MSLKKLQKLVKGVQGRNDASGVSELKTWAAFEEKSKLLWTNAYFYNEEGSEIYSLAQELEVCICVTYSYDFVVLTQLFQKAFYVQFKKAQAAVPEPAGPRIKLKVGQGSETPGSSKKITINVARGGSTDSPAPHGAETPGVNGDAVDATDSPTPSAMKTEDAVTPANETPAPVVAPVPQVPAVPVEPRRPRRDGHSKSIARILHDRILTFLVDASNALLSRVRLFAHPLVHADFRVAGTVFPAAKYMQNSVVINLPAYFNRAFVVPSIPDALADRQYNLWALIDKQLLRPVPQAFPNQSPQDRVFEILLHPGLNVIEAHMIAAIPGFEREPGGAEAELEVLTMYVNVGKP